MLLFFLQWLGNWKRNRLSTCSEQENEYSEEPCADDDNVSYAIDTESQENVIGKSKHCKQC